MDPSPSARRFDPARLLARLLCLVFGVVGALPLGAELLLRHPAVERWVAVETARVLSETLGVEAEYQVRLHLIPLGLDIDRLRVPSTDGKGPALRVERLRVTPRLLSLLAGRLDLGDVEIDGLRARAVVRGERVTNVRYRLPESRRSGPAAKQAPFDTLSLGDARLVLDIEGTQISTGPMDLDVFAERGPAFEVVLRAGESGVARSRRALAPSSGPPEAAAAIMEGGVEVERRDHDALCRLELRARLAGRELLVRRLSLLGAADMSGEGRRPSCQVADDAVERVAVRLSQLQVAWPANGAPTFAGRVFARAPLALVNRFVRMLPLAGFAAFSGDVRFDGRHRLPELSGRLNGRGLRLERYRLAQDLDVELGVSGDVVQVPRLRMRFADGETVLRGARIEPFAPGAPISVERVNGDGMSFPGLMRDLGVTPDTLVAWQIKIEAEGLRGTLSPLRLDGQLEAETRDFEVFDRAFHDPARRHMIGVRAARLSGKIGVRPNALLFYDQRASFGKSHLFVKLVSIGFDNQMELDIPPGSKLELADVTPLVTVPWSGSAELDVKMRGISGDPLLTGHLAIKGFEMGGFPVGDVESADVTFRPLWLEFRSVQAKKGSSHYTLPAARLDFETSASMLVEARTRSESLDVRDFFDMWHFDEDPRFESIKGRTLVDARVRYVLGGPEDRCGGGLLKVSGKLSSPGLELFEEHYDRGEADFDLLWDDRDASFRGVTLRVSELALGKGSGTLGGSMELSPGARVSGQLVASGVPLAEIDSLPSVLRAAAGTASGTATLSGSLDALAANADLMLSRVSVRRASLPPSALQVRLEPIADPPESSGKTRCGQPRSGPFDREKYERDLPQGRFHTSGELFGGQILLEDLVVTRQRTKTVQGALRAANFDLGAALELLPETVLAGTPVSGTASGRLELEELRLAEPTLARGKLTLSALALARGGYRVELLPETQAMSFGGRELHFPGAAFAFATPRGQKASLDVAGKFAGLGQRPTVDAELSMRPTPLAGLVGVLPNVERASGTLGGKLRLVGPLREPRYSGGFRVEHGEIALRRFATPISNIDLRLSLDESEVSIAKATARIGGGTLSMSGGAPLRGLSLGEARLNVTLRDLALPLDDGVHSVADAELLVSWRPSAPGQPRTLPRVAGNVLLHSLEYRRGVTMTADLNALARRGKRTEFETYDPSEDVVAFDLNIKAKRPLELENELIEARLVLPEEGLDLAGTNGRFGARGAVAIQPGGRITLRRSEFEITEGSVRFDDPDRIDPEVDVTAVTEYRRYSDAPSSGESGAGTSTVGSSSSATGGRWAIRMHAYGDADNLHVDLSSDPALPQDDIFLLLTVGLTRAELDQTQSASVGESVALEALGTLTGADRAVKDVVPVIDEFSFGSAYSSRTGRTEPTVTIGKRLTQRVRGNVTTGLAESREIRSNVEWQLSPRVSVEGSYDNVNDISSSSLGNLGADIRWRLEFE